jgi:DNA-binding response OmpR family regulator
VGLSDVRADEDADSHASRLRRKLCDGGEEKLLVNVWGVSYRL